MSLLSGKRPKKGNYKREQPARSTDIEAKSAQEEHLESFLFGDTQSLAADSRVGNELTITAPQAHVEPEIEEEAPEFGFSVDTVGDKRKNALDDSDDDDSTQKKLKIDEAPAAKPAWQDVDDQEVTVNIADKNRLRKLRMNESESNVSGTELESRLRARHSQMNPNAADWAKLPASATKQGDQDDEDNENAFLSSNASLLGMAAGKLAQGQLQITRMKDANHQEMSQSAVSSVKFHNNGQLMLTSGLDKRLRLFQIDGLNNPKVQSVYFEDLPITSAQFTPDGNEIFLSGRRKFFYSYDVVAGAITKVPFLKGRSEKSLESMVVSPANDFVAFLGQDGHTLLVSRTTKQLLHTIKMNGSVRSAAFSSDGQQLYTSGDDGQVYLWDVRNLKCAHRFTDEGCVHSTSLAIAPNNAYLAAGSNSGVVNLYSADAARTSVTPSPLRAFMNLTTRVDDIVFNHDAQIMAMSSKRNKDSFKLVHLPSKTVFSNWPTSSTPLSYVQCTAFTPNSGYMAIGNDKGKVLLYRLNHFTSS